jgi:hypothetical protein
MPGEKPALPPFGIAPRSDRGEAVVDRAANELTYQTPEICAGESEKCPPADMPSRKIAFGPGGAITLDGVTFGARGILLLAPPGVMDDRRSRDLGQPRR